MSYEPSALNPAFPCVETSFAGNAAFGASVYDSVGHGEDPAGLASLKPVKFFRLTFLSPIGCYI